MNPDIRYIRKTTHAQLPFEDVARNISNQMMAAHWGVFKSRLLGGLTVAFGNQGLSDENSKAVRDDFIKYLESQGGKVKAEMVMGSDDSGRSAYSWMVVFQRPKASNPKMKSVKCHFRELDRIVSQNFGRTYALCQSAIARKVLKTHAI